MVRSVMIILGFVLVVCASANYSSANALPIEELNTSKIFSLTSEDVRKISKSKNVNLSNLGIKKLEPGCFGGLKKLESIDLSNNEIEEIPDNVFNNLTVRNLYLNDNCLRNISGTAFDNMPILEEIHFENNQLNKMDHGVWFNNCPRLRIIYFKGNYEPPFDKIEKFQLREKTVKHVV